MTHFTATFHLLRAWETEGLPHRAVAHERHVRWHRILTGRALVGPPCHAGPGHGSGTDRGPAGVLCDPCWQWCCDWRRS